MAALTVPTIFTAVDKMSSVLSKMQGNVGKFASESQKKYAAMSRSMQNIQTNASQIGMAAGIIGTALVAPLVLATKAAADFEDQMATIGTTVGAGNVPLLSAGVLETLKRTTAPLHELTDGLYKITSAGVPAAKAIGVLNEAAKLALIGRGTVPEAADALTSAMNVFKDEGLSSNKIMSMLFQTIATGKTTIAGMSESFGATANVIHHGGVSLTDFLAATKAMTIMGEPASQAMNQIRASVFGLEMPSKRMRFIFHELGVKDVHQLIKKFGDLGGAMQAVQDMGQKHGVTMAAAWHKLGSYAAVINLTSPTGKASYKQGQLDMANSEQAAAAAYALKMKTLAAQLKLVKNNMEAFSITLGTTLIPVLTALLPKISALVDMVGKWIDRHQVLARWILVITGGLGGLLLVIAPLAFAVAGVASVMKIWAGYQLLLAERAALATAAIEAEHIAAMSATGATAAMGGAVSSAAGSFTVASGAATGFLAVITRLLGPIGLLLIAWDNYNSIIDQAHMRSGGWADQPPPKMTTADILKKNHEAYLKAHGFLHPTGIDPNNGFRTFKPNTDAKVDSAIRAIIPGLNTIPIAPAAAGKPDPGVMHITVDDKNGIIKDVKHNGNSIFPDSLIQRSTTGNR